MVVSRSYGVALPSRLHGLGGIAYALLLYVNFGSLAESLIVMVSLPFALVGSVWLLWALGYNLSVAVWVGLIALAGVAAEIGVVMLVYLDHAYRKRTRAGVRMDAETLTEAVLEGAGERVRPVLMTVMAVVGGLLPILWGHGTGATVMKRIAAPMVGGMISATVLTLLVVPALFAVWRGAEAARTRVTAKNAVTPSRGGAARALEGPRT